LFLAASHPQPQQQARNPPSIREASEDKQIHRFLHRSNEKVRNLTRFTCNPMESDAALQQEGLLTTGYVVVKSAVVVVKSY